MLINLYKHPLHPFAMASFTGNIDDISLKEYVATYNQLLKDTPCLELADCRYLTSINGLTVKGMIDASRRLEDNPQSTLAILTPDSSLMYGMARAFQPISEHRRKKVKIFKEPKDAIQWLAKDQADLFLKWFNSPGTPLFTNK